MNKASRMFIAGHNGLIGSACVRHFTAQGFSQILTKTRAELELKNREEVFDFFSEAKPDYVIIAAGKVGGIVENQQNPADFMNENLQLQLNVMSAAQQFEVKRVVFFASSCMYPRECEQPMHEEQLLTGVPEPTSLAYAVAKLAGLQLCLSYNKQFSTDRFLPVIPNSVYGANDNFDPTKGHVLSALMHRFHTAKTNGDATVTLWGSGNPRREFVFSDDVAAACHFLLEAGPKELPINIGTGEDISIRELARLIAKIVGYEGAIAWDTSKPDGAPRKLLDSSRIHSLGWSAKTALEDGLQATYAWYQAQRKTV